MIIALAFEIIILAWTVLSCICFCCPNLYPLLTIITAVATACLVVAVALYGGNNSNSTGIQGIAITDTINSTLSLGAFINDNINRGAPVAFDDDTLQNVGYSFWWVASNCLNTRGCCL